jgi:hypothetical protein
MVDEADFDRLGSLLPSAGDISGGTGGAGASRTAAGTGGASAARGAGAADAGEGARAGGAARAGAEADLSQRLAAVWPEAMGAEVAANAKPVQFRDGRLVVTTSSSAWAQTLQLMSEMVVARLNERLGPGAVGKAVFRHAGWEDFLPPSVRPETAGRTAVTPRRRTVPPDIAPAPAPQNAAASVPDMATPAPDMAATHPATPPGMVPDPVNVRREFPAEEARLPGEGEVRSSGDEDLFSDEERRALADLEQLPLPPSIKATIRAAMKADFVRVRQDSGR